MNPTLQKPKHFFTLDIVRGIGALIVVIHHWQHFYYTGNKLPIPFDWGQLPFYSLLSFVYINGYLAVDIFFTMSGFIFFWLYADRVASRKVSGGVFFFTRFSRLYPMHILSLVLVIVLQYRVLKTTGEYFIYTNNDIQHLLLNIFLINSWGFEKGPSFNGPVWTVSVEVMMYIIFFCLCYWKRNRSWLVLTLLIVAGFVIQPVNSMIGRGMSEFFIGGIVYYIYRYIISREDYRKMFRRVVMLTCLSAVLVVVGFKLGPLLLSRMNMTVQTSQGAGKSISYILTNMFARIFAGPLLVLSLVLYDTIYKRDSHRLHAFGNSSYACYLLHFPLQLMFLVVADALGYSREVFRSPVMLILFLVIICPLSIAAYYYFELPAQQTLRNWLLRKGKYTKPVPVDNPV
ncbi:MAG TPA: acyltransferase [Chitinophaga sp.]|uniref:acyltransferase family protein n=1 Tax=Chitinophaga sp. TaxID=1869181 RepID=UPI002BFE2FCD|nr:acyltransferase [Chitinophaga sp.]HVI44232.1 acyltransferase [Chitinophaga sp.]